MVGEHEIIRRRGEDEARRHASANAPQEGADCDDTGHPGDGGDNRGKGGRQLCDMTGGERGERDAPGEQLRFVEAFVGQTAYLRHEPVAVFHHVPRQEHPARVVRLPDRLSAQRGRENNDRKGEHDEEG